MLCHCGKTRWNHQYHSKRLNLKAMANVGPLENQNQIKTKIAEFLKYASTVQNQNRIVK